MPFTAGQRLRASRLNQVINKEAFTSSACSLSTTSATYVDITGASQSFTKVGSATDSDVIVEIDLSCYVTVASTSMRIAAQINGTDYDVTFMLQNTANVHGALPWGAVRITGIPAGVYTVKARCKRVTGTGTVTIDGSDNVSITVSERPI